MLHISVYTVHYTVKLWLLYTVFKKQGSFSYCVHFKQTKKFWLLYSLFVKQSSFGFFYTLFNNHGSFGFCIACRLKGEAHLQGQAERVNRLSYKQEVKCPHRDALTEA